MLGPLDSLRALRRRRRLKALGRRLSTVRRFAGIAPVPGRRLVAMTFDDGPTKGVTEQLIAVLVAAGAHATFNVIGSTAENYPDRPGRPGTAAWSGVRFDHYAAHDRDNEAGAASKPELVQRLWESGCELANHSYRHVQFGPERLVYRRRAYLPDALAVESDLRRLDALLARLTGTRPLFARPPHYVDGPAYGVYAALGYQYLAASFDGGGWQPSSGDSRRDVRAMVDPLEAALAANPDALDGRIIFQKDGYNMSLRAPVVDALPLQLAVLARYGYRVVTAAALWDQGQFADVRGDDWPEALALAAQGVPVAYRDNTLRPDLPLLRGELAMLLAATPDCEPASPGTSAGGGPSLGALPRDVAAHHPYRQAIDAALKRLPPDPGGYFYPNRPVDAATWRAAGLRGYPSSPVSRGEAIRIFCGGS